MYNQEKQLTSCLYGHTIHNAQVFSPDDNWVVYDTRNDDTQIGRTGRIEMVNIHNGEVRELYRTKKQSVFGPGVGAASFSPVENKVIFIHGVRNADKKNPYAASRRTGFAIYTDHPQEPVFMDARNVKPPFTPGALRGGTHAHSWAGDGKWLSFTYNDLILEKKKPKEGASDLRTVGVMAPGEVYVDEDSMQENNSGTYFSALVAQVTMEPRPGSDEIDRAFDETWVGKAGYRRADGSWQKRAIAFQGNIRDSINRAVTEVFVLDLPDNIKEPQPNRPLEGTMTSLPNVPAGVVQRRLTYGAHITGPRHWLRSTPDGSLIFYLAEDVKGCVQLFSIPSVGGICKQITNNPFPIQGPFNVSPDGKEIAYAADNSICTTAIFSGVTKRITPRFSDNERPIGAPVYSNNGKYLAYNRYVGSGRSRFLQLFLLTVTE